MLFVVVIDVGKGLASLRIDVGLDSLVKDSNQLVFGYPFFWQLVICEPDFFLLEGLLSNLCRLLFKVVNLLVPDEREFIAHSKSQFSNVAHQAELTSRLDGESSSQQSNHNDEHKDMLCHSQPSFLNDPVGELLMAGRKMRGCSVHNQIFNNQQKDPFIT